MKHFNILLLIFVISLAACEDADDKIKRTTNTVVVHEGTRFILCTPLYEPLDTIVVKETRVLNGATSIQQNVEHVGYSINGLKYRFKTYNVFDNIFFNFEGDNLVWIGSRSINSGFYFEELTVKKTNNKNIELEFAGEKMSNGFASSNNNYTMRIEGKISFSEK